MTQEVRTRMAPSPTGFLHVGSLRTALFNFLLARKNNGKFILRVEDTDQARIVPGALESIVQTLADFSLNPDEGLYWENGVKEKGGYGPYLQSKRLSIYKKYADELIANKAAYYCFCTQERLDALRKEQQAQKLPPKYDKLCLKLSEEEVRQKIAKGEPHVIRLNVPSDKQISFTDLVHGEISVSGADLDDQVLVKSDGFPTYHLAVVVDDHLMNITHVLRGDEWVVSTPKHILLYSAFGWEPPKFAHLPLLLSKSRKKLGKREGDVAVKDFLEKGYLPEALLNFVALLGWNPKTEEEIFNLRELIDQFSLDKLNKAGAVFDLEKLDWLNGVYIRKLGISELTARTLPFLKKAGIDFENYPQNFIQKLLSLEQERLKKLSEIGERVQYFFRQPEYEAELLVWKKSTKDATLKNLQELAVFFETLEFKGLNKQEIEQKLKALIEAKKLTTGEVLWPLRVALTGLEASPGPFEIVEAMAVLPKGKELVLQRINAAIEKIS